MTIQADGAGTLEILAEEGATLAVGEPIAQLVAGAQPARRPRPRNPRPAWTGPTCA